MYTEEKPAVTHFLTLYAQRIQWRNHVATPFNPIRPKDSAYVK